MEKNIMKQGKRIIIRILVLALIFANMPINQGMAASHGYVKKLTVSKKTISMKKGTSKKINYQVKVYRKASKKVKAVSSNKGVVSVTVKKSYILLKAKKKGNATITITSSAKGKKNKKLKKTIKVKVTNASSTTSPKTTILPTATPIPVKKGDYTRKQWVELLSQKLNFNLDTSSISKDLYYYGDTETKDYGLCAELANAYGILPDSDAKEYNDPKQDIPLFEGDKYVTREYAAYTIVKALGYEINSTDVLTCKDSDDAKYSAEDAMAVKQNVILLNNNCFNPDGYLSKDDGLKMLNMITKTEKSTQINEDEKKESISYNDSVDCSLITQQVKYTLVQEGNIYKVTISNNYDLSSLSEGKTFLLPADSSNGTEMALKITSINSNTENMVLVCAKPETEEIISDLSYVGMGDVQTDAIEPAEDVSYEYVPPESNKDTVETKNRNNKIGGSIAVPGKLQFKVANKEISDGMSVSGKIEVSIPDVTCKVDVKGSLFSGLQFKELVLKITDKIKFTGSFECKFAESGYEITHGSGTKEWHGGNIELGRVPIAIGTSGLSLDIILFYNVNAKGTASVGYSIERTQGIQIVNNTPRVIHDFSQSFDTLSIKGSVKAGIGVEFALSVLGMDLVGVETSIGVGVSASYTPHLDENPVLHCIDARIYFYWQIALSKDTALDAFLKLVSKYDSLSWDIFDEENSPLKRTLHFENGVAVDRCTYGSGNIEGTVMDAYGNKISGAKVIVLKDGIYLKSTYTTGSNGKFTISELTDGEYTIKVFYSGSSAYENIVTVQAGKTTYIETFVMISRNNNEIGKVSGDIINAVNGNYISDLTYNLRANWNNVSGTVLKSGTCSKNYEFDLNPGHYTIEFSADGYISNKINISVVSNDETYKNIALSPNLTKDDGLLRVVLTWSEYPYDLDSHLIGPKVDGDGTFHIYYDDDNYYEYINDSEVKIVDLDIDDTSSYGPETITLHQTNEKGIYSYYVHDFSNRNSNESSELAYSDAKVQIYRGLSLVQEFNVPTTQEGTLWHVFDYNAATDKINAINTFSYESNDGSVGSGE